MDSFLQKKTDLGGKNFLQESKSFGDVNQTAAIYWDRKLLHTSLKFAPVDAQVFDLFASECLIKKNNVLTASCCFS